jgi:hypothetical protein
MKQLEDVFTRDAFASRPKSAAERQAARRARLAAAGVVQVQVFVDEASYQVGRVDAKMGVNPGEFPDGLDPLSYLAGWQSAQPGAVSRFLADRQSVGGAGGAPAARPAVASPSRGSTARRPRRSSRAG